MKTSIKAIALLTLMLSIVCGHGQTTSTITSFYYRHSTPMAIYGDTEYDLKVNSDGKAYITFDRNNPLSGTTEADASVLDNLQQIVNKYKIHNYKSNYQLDVEIRDGSMWSLAIRYADDTYFTSSGTNAWPDNAHEAFSAIRGAMDKYRIRIWEGTFASCPTDYWDYGQYSNSDYSLLKNSPYTITVGPVQSDNSCSVTFTAKGDYTLLCKGIIDIANDKMSIYLNDIKTGFLPCAKPFDWSKPLFELSCFLNLTDSQELGIFGKDIHLKFARPKD